MIIRVSSQPTLPSYVSAGWQESHAAAIPSDQLFTHKLQCKLPKARAQEDWEPTGFIVTGPRNWCLRDQIFMRSG